MNTKLTTRGEKPQCSARTTESKTKGKKKEKLNCARVYFLIHDFVLHIPTLKIHKQSHYMVITTTIM